MQIGVFGFLILIHFLFQINYVACHSSSFYQVLGRPIDPKKMGLASLTVMHLDALIISTPLGFYASKYETTEKGNKPIRKCSTGTYH